MFNVTERSIQTAKRHFIVNITRGSELSTDYLSKPVGNSVRSNLQNFTKEAETKKKHVINIANFLYFNTIKHAIKIERITDMTPAKAYQLLKKNKLGL